MNDMERVAKTSAITRILGDDRWRHVTNWKVAADLLESDGYTDAARKIGAVVRTLEVEAVFDPRWDDSFKAFESMMLALPGAGWMWLEKRTIDVEVCVIPFFSYGVESGKWPNAREDAMHNAMAWLTHGSK